MVGDRVRMSPGWSLPLMVLWTLCRAAEAQLSIAAQCGADVILNCTFSCIPGVKLHRLNITWKMQRAGGADLLVHSYYGKMNLWQKHDKVYRGRTQLYPEDFHKGNASLRLMDVRIQDEGSYFCYVSSELGSLSKKISLMVLRKSEVDSPIVAQVGDNITLSCPFEFGLTLQHLNITWKKEAAEGPDLLVHSYYNGTDKLQRQDVSYKDRTQLYPERFPQGNASLTLRRVRTQDKGFYICHVKPELGWFSVRMQVAVKDMKQDFEGNWLSLILWSALCLALMLMIIIIQKHCASVLQKLRTLQMTDMNRQSYGEVTTEYRRGFSLLKPESHVDTWSSSSSVNEKEFEAAVKEGNLKKAALMVQQIMKSPGLFEVAITGESGSGKSSFINAFRGVGDDDEGAAEVGVVETTVRSTAYSHPQYPNVSLWDLPGIGTPNFQLNDHKLTDTCSLYDFFLIITATRFKDIHAKLAQKLQEKGKKFYFVRSKVDLDLQAEKRKKNYSEERTLQQIRKDCKDHLQSAGVNDPHVFLLSSRESHKYDFPLLKETLHEERHQLILEKLLSISWQTLQEKKIAMQKTTREPATLSGRLTASPLPGLSLFANIAILVDHMRNYCKEFGLDSDSLRVFAEQVGKCEEDLKAPGTEITADLVVQLLALSAGGGVSSLTYFAWSLPVIGSLFSAEVSFGMTMSMLDNFISNLAEDTQRVLTKALLERREFVSAHDKTQELG